METISHCPLPVSSPGINAARSVKWVSTIGTKLNRAAICPDHITPNMNAFNTVSFKCRFTNDIEREITLACLKHFLVMKHRLNSNLNVIILSYLDTHFAMFLGTGDCRSRVNAWS